MDSAAPSPSPNATNDAVGLPELRIQGRSATMTLRRPAVANRLTPEDLLQIHAHLEQVNRSDVLVLCITGAGKHFCSGFDLGQLDPKASGSVFEDMANAVEDCRAVTIAAINGGVYGGATDLALACDFRIGVDHTEMFMPAARLGLHFYQRGLERYVSRLGVDTAKRLFLTAEKLSADEMLRVGFLTDKVSADQLQSRVDALAATVSGMAPLAVTGMKKHLNHIARGRLDPTALQQDIQRAAASDDIREGALAWKEKRQPVFQGR